MTSDSSLDLLLDSAFEACDVEGAGEVPAYRILEYLQNVTGQSWEGEGLCSLYKMLDPEERGVSVNLKTFRNVMTNWIADCRQEWVLEGSNEEDTLIERMFLQPSGMREVSGPSQLEAYGGDLQKGSLGEAADLMSSIEDLEFANKKLSDQNIKLQRSVELSDESVTRLTEEISQLKSSLKSNQLALHHAKSAVNELEDLKTVTKSLEERNSELQFQSRQLVSQSVDVEYYKPACESMKRSNTGDLQLQEKEQQCLNAQLQMLRKENGKLLTERERERKKADDLKAERKILKHQLCEYERLISQKDMLLSERINQAEELTGTVEEYRVMTQELKVEIRRLQDQLSQTSGDLSRLVKDPLEEVPSFVRLQVQSLCTEIEDLMQGGCIEEGLASPLCGVFPWSSIGAYTVEVLLVELCAEMSSTDFWCITEELVTHCREGTLAVIELLPSDRENRSSQESLVLQIESLRQELKEQSQVFLQRLNCLTELKRTWEAYLCKLKIGLQKFKQLDQKEKPACVYTRMSADVEKDEKKAEIMNNEERAQEDTAEYDEGADGVQRQNTKMQKVICPAFLESERQGSTTSSERRTDCDLSLVPVNNELVLWRPQSCRGATVPWSSCNLRNLWQGRCWLFLALLLILLLFILLLVLLSFPHTGREPIWAAMELIFWPHIQLQYLRPPPV